MATDPNDLDLLLAEPAKPGGKECHVCFYVRTYTGPDRDKLAQVADGQYDVAKTQQAFTRRGISVSEATIRRHRKLDHQSLAGQRHVLPRG